MRTQQEAETCSAGSNHPGTALEVLRSGRGYYVGFVDADGCPYSRESNYFATQEAADKALMALAPHTLEQLARGRYLCHVRSRFLMISIELFRGDRDFAVIELTEYQLRIGDACVYHDLIDRRTVPPSVCGGLLGAAIAEANKFLNDEGLGQMRLATDGERGAVVD